MTGAARAIYRYLLAILFIALVVQVFLAGLGVFGVVSAAAEGETSVTQDTIEDEFTPHAVLGSLIVLGMILTFLVSLAARLGRDRILWTLALPILGIIQLILAGAGESSQVVGALHALNALVLLGLTGYLAHGAWRRWTDLGEPVGEPRAERV